MFFAPVLLALIAVPAFAVPVAVADTQLAERSTGLAGLTSATTFSSTFLVRGLGDDNDNDVSPWDAETDTSPEWGYESTFANAYRGVQNAVVEDESSAQATQGKTLISTISKTMIQLLGKHEVKIYYVGEWNWDSAHTTVYDHNFENALAQFDKLDDADKQKLIPIVKQVYTALGLTPFEAVEQ